MEPQQPNVEPNMEQPNDMNMSPQSENPEMGELVNTLEQNPELIDMTKKYVDGILKSQGKDPNQQQPQQSVQQEPNQMQQQMPTESVDNLDALIDEVIGSFNKPQ